MTSDVLRIPFATQPMTTPQKRRDHLLQLCRALPEVAISGDQHLIFQVRKKTFAYYLNDHHGDGRVALCCKAAPGVQELLVEWDPSAFYVPSYVGSKGWLALRLDLEAVDWGQAADLLDNAYRLVAPKRLAALVERPFAPGVGAHRT